MSTARAAEAIDDILARQPAASLEVRFSQAQISAFEAQGYIWIERITTDEEVAWLREIYDWLFEDKRRAMKGAHFDLVRPYESQGEDRLPQVLAPEERLPALTATAFWRNGRKLAAQLLRLDPERLEGCGHMIRKPPKIGESLPWRQDEACWEPSMAYRAVGCWMPLDDATIENGCMSFIPHVGEVRPHRHVGDDPTVHALSTTPDPADIAQANPAPAPAGGAVFHHSRTLHASGPNTTDRVRRAYANEWQLTPQRAEPTPDRPWITEFKAAWAARKLI